ncbi:MAG TPA: hypothetical protein VK698_23165 [Kofleriaceae bacterium]|nr:hypothetical protein [Kofleriaceae bacterium]
MIRRSTAALALVALFGGSAGADPHAVPGPPAVPEPPGPPGDDRAASQPWSIGVSAERKARATELLARGNELLVENRYAAALEQYRLAIRAWDHPAIRANMVVCLINLGRPLEAYESALLALKYGPAPHQKPEVYAETVNYRKLLEGQIAALRVSCGEPGARVTMDGQDLLVCPARSTRRLLAGRHQIVARKPGFLTVTRDFTSVPGRTEAVDIRLIRVTEAAVIQQPWPSWKPWAVTGTGAGLMLLGGLLELKARADMDRHDADLEQMCMDDGCSQGEIGRALADLESRAELEDRIAITAAITGGAVAVTGLVWVYLNRPRTVMPGESGFALRVSPLATPDAAGLVLGGRF